MFDNKDTYISEILENIARNSEWNPFLASADAYQQTKTGFQAIYKWVGTIGVGDYYNDGENKYRVSNKKGETNTYAQNILIDVNIKKSSEMYYSATEYAGFENPEAIFNQQKLKQIKDWIRMHDLEVLTLLTKGGTGKSEKATVIPVDVKEFMDGKALRRYISQEALKIKRKGLITEDKEHVGINSGDIVIALAPQQFSLIIEDYAVIDNSTVDLRADIGATKIDGILVYENLYLDAEIDGDTANTWMVVAVRNRIALPTSIEGAYDNVIFKADHVVGLYGVMGKGILDGSLVTCFKNVSGIKPESNSKEDSKENSQIKILKEELKNLQQANKKLIKEFDENFNKIQNTLKDKDLEIKELKKQLKDKEKEQTTAK